MWHPITNYGNYFQCLNKEYIWDRTVLVADGYVIECSRYNGQFKAFKACLLHYNLCFPSQSIHRQGPDKGLCWDLYGWV